MIVDCHTHVNLDTDAGTSEHLAAAETVDVCIVLASAGATSEQTNKRLSEYINKHGDRLIGFGVVEPTEDKVSLSSVTVLREKLGFKGVVLHCSACGFHPAHSRAMRLYESLQELDMPVFFHNGYPVPASMAVLEYAQSYLLDEVARAFPALKVVVGSMGAPFTEQTLALVAKHENVYADLAVRPSSIWQIYNTVVAAHEHGVMDKLLFGSGFPLSTAGQCIETLLGFNMLLADTNLPTVPRDRIRKIIERDTLKLLGIGHEMADSTRRKGEIAAERKKKAVEEPEGAQS